MRTVGFPPRERNAGNHGAWRAVAFAILVLAQLVSPAARALEAEQVFDKVAPSIVLVLARSRHSVSQGSGVVVAPQRVITNCHVVNKGAQLTVKWRDRQLPATIEREDSKRDLCRLAVPALDAPAVQQGKLASVRIGQRVYAIGNPEGLELTLTEGLVSAIRVVAGQQLIQTSAPYTRGSSGGGLFDADGDLIAITSAGVKEGLGLNFAIPAEYVFEGEPQTAVAQAPTPAEAPNPVAIENTQVAVVTYPRRLTGAEFVAHFKRFSQIEINPKDGPRKLTFLPGGKVTSYCASCPMNHETRSPFREGKMTLVPRDGQVCFQWYFTEYPQSGCFHLMETAPNDFALRKPRGKTPVVYYSLPPLPTPPKEPTKELPLSARP